MIIAIDLDSTLNNLLDVWLWQYNQDYNDDVMPQDILSWDVHEYVKAGKAVYKYLNDPETYTLCSPQSNSIPVTQRLAAQHDLVIVSACAKGTYDAKREWCKKHYPHIEHFVATHSKNFIRAHMLIDDAVHNLETFPGHTICYDQPYNQDWRGNRVCNWLELELTAQMEGWL